MITLADRASIVAADMHKGQIRFDGTPYWSHVRRVADLVRLQKFPDHVVAAAYLHDVVEDGHTTFTELHSSYEFPVMVVALVRILTRRSTESYDEYIERVARHPEASAIKRANLIENMSTLPPGHSLWHRYLKALVRLHNV